MNKENLGFYIIMDNYYILFEAINRYGIKLIILK